MLRFLAVLVPLVVAAGSAAAGGGPAPGVVTGWDGVVDRHAGVRYVSLPSAATTTVAALRASDGRVLRWTTVRGVFGVPAVAFDGTTEGVSRDGATLVLAGIGAPDSTRFAVFRTSPLRLRKVIRLQGYWAFDALSPDGRLVYATQYESTGANARYAVRAISVATGRPVGGAIVDKREPDEEMNGSPLARVRSANAVWAYTLYSKPAGGGFVHALDTVHRRAFCIDLPWHSSARALNAVRLSLANGGRALTLSRGGTRLAVVDTRTFAVRAFRRP